MNSGEWGDRPSGRKRAARRCGRLFQWLVVAFGLGWSLLVSRGAFAADGDASWYKLQSKNFEMFTNVREPDATRLIREVETFRFVVSRFLGLTNVQRRPAMLFYFANDKGFTPFKPQYHGAARAVSGFHVEDPLDYVLALSRQRKDATTMRVLFHEYTHLLTVRQFRSAPIWAHEGIAEVFATFVDGETQFDIGVALTNHVRYLQKEGVGSLVALVNVAQPPAVFVEVSSAPRLVQLTATFVELTDAAASWELDAAMACCVASAAVKNTAAPMLLRRCGAMAITAWASRCRGRRALCWRRKVRRLRRRSSGARRDDAGSHRAFCRRTWWS